MKEVIADSEQIFHLSREAKHEIMFKNFPISCCKEYVCNFCLNPDELVDKEISIRLKELRRQTYNERKLLLLGKADMTRSYAEPVFLLVSL